MSDDLIDIDRSQLHALMAACSLAVCLAMHEPAAFGIAEGLWLIFLLEKGWGIDSPLLIRGFFAVGSFLLAMGLNSDITFGGI